MQNIVALIPARSGSKRIKNKNIIQLGKHPMLSYSIAAAKSCKLIKDVYVTTDSIKISKIANKYGAKTPFLRPKNISKDNSRDLSFFKHFIKYLNDNNKEIPELIVHLSPTVPFRDKNIILKAINYINSKKQSTSLRSVNKINLTPYKIFKKNDIFLSGFFPDLKYEYYNMPRQKFCETYLPNGHVDIIKTSKIKNNNLHGNKILAFETDITLDVDTIKDIKNIKKYINNKKYNYLNKFL